MRLAPTRRSTDRDLVAVAEAAVRAGHRRHQFRVVAAAAGAHLGERGGVAQAVAAEVRRGAVAAGVVRAGRQEAAIGVLGGTHPQPRLPALARAAAGEPVRQTQMIGVEVGGDHAQHRRAVEHRVEDALPRGHRLLRGDAAVDDGEAGHALDFVLQQPQVDVVEREGQRHAQPVDAGAQGGHGAGGGHIGPWVAQFVFEGVQGSRM
jgi:hypothetical protein